MIETNETQTSITYTCQNEASIEDSHPAQSSPQMLQETLTSAIAQLKNELHWKLQQLLSNQEQQLSEVGSKINFLTQELEQAILDFQKIARVANHTYRSLQSSVEVAHQTTDGDRKSVIPDELNIVATHPAKLPVVEKYGLGYILKDKTLDLSKLQFSLHAAKSRESLERWLVTRRQEMKDKFSGIS
jgi:hypothetical protein